MVTIRYKSEKDILIERDDAEGLMIGVIDLIRLPLACRQQLLVGGAKSFLIQDVRRLREMPLPWLTGHTERKIADLLERS